ncbi:cystin-1 [Zootoca vivipara]|uniref:cystin-1 n=1 Tax=Zootoca vivipara TaxID=8524 RepID=UPI001590FBC2|nr:cystin-1 [Zootoca vivipara]
MAGTRSRVTKEQAGAAASHTAGLRRRRGDPAMGTGSSRPGKGRSSVKPWRGPGRGSRSISAPARQGRAEEEQGAAAEARCYSQTPARATTSPSAGESDSDSELLDRVLEECGDEGFGQPTGGRRRRHPLLLLEAAGDCCSRPAEGSGEEVFSGRSTPDLESNNNANQLPLKKLERQAKISYDYSEEELMATIEQEYCR